MLKIRRDDDVIVIAGRDKGRQGKVLKLVKSVERRGRKTNGRVRIRALVEGVNIVKKHVKPNPQANQQGGILEREAAIDISNLAIYNPMTKKADRVGFKFLEDGKKVRFFKSSGELVDI